MGRIRNFLKNTVISGLATIVISCSSYPGDPLKGEYAPLTPERKTQIERVINEKTGQDAIVVDDKYNPDFDGQEVLEFGEEPKELINHLNDFINNDKEQKGVIYPDISNITTTITSNIAKFCGPYAGACNGEGHIFLPYSELDWIIPISFHEIGHTIFPGSEEFPAKGNEVYMGLKLYQFSKPIGSTLIYSVINSMNSLDLSLEDPLGRMYNQGAMFGAINLLNFNGDIELATNHVAHSKTILIEAEIQDRLNQTEGETRADKYFNIWNQLLNLPEFKAELTSSTGHLSELEAEELIDYLKIINHSKYTFELTNEEEVWNKLNELRETFIHNPNYTNPYFKARVTLSHLNYQGREATRLSNEFGIKSDEYYNHLEDVIDLNLDYPCSEINEYTCPRFARTINTNIPHFYEASIFSALSNHTLEKDESAISRAREFLKKYYPNSDINNPTSLNGIDQLETNHFAVEFMTYCGQRSILNGKDEDALTFLKASLNINCLDLAEGPSIENCNNNQTYSAMLLNQYFPSWDE
jgi:hypothetical protein